MKKYTIEQMIEKGSCKGIDCENCSFANNRAILNCIAMKWASNHDHNLSRGLLPFESSILYINHIKKLKLIDKILLSKQTT